MKKQILPISEVIANIEKGAVILDGLDDCIVGVTSNNTLIYSYIQMIKHFMFCGLSQTEAIEWIEFNVIPLEQQNLGFVTLYEVEYL